MAPPAFLARFLTVKTVKLVEIKHWKLALFHYLVIVGILSYVIGYQIIWKKGYQRVDQLTGEVNIKVKGNAAVYTPSGPINWDEYDVIYPFKEENAFFATTGFQITYAQSRAVCPAFGVPCNATNPCKPAGSFIGTGISTGTCTNNVCQIQAWCPAEVDAQPQILSNLGNFTVFPKASVLFPGLGVQLTNAKGSSLVMDKTLFTIDSMLGQSGVNLTTVSSTGAVIFANMNWKCNLDRDEDLCDPTLKFTRVDDPESFSPGFNFRYTKSYSVQQPSNNPNNANWTEYRDLYKVYGLRFVFLASGTGGKFDIATLMTSLGAGIALLSVATVLTDLLVLYIAPRRDFYKEHKFETVRQDEIADENSALYSRA